MPLGGFAPLPLRLGEGLSAPEQSRICADILSIKRTAPLCVFTFVKSGAAISVQRYLGRDGEGPAPHSVERLSRTNNGTGDVTFTISAGLEDPLGAEHGVKITHATASIHGTAGGKATCTWSANTVRVRTFDTSDAAADARVTVEVYTSDVEDVSSIGTHAAIGDYGGDPDKHDSETEGQTPYAWTWYRELQAMRGSAYSKERGTLVHCENLAIARSEAARTRTAEKLRKNAQPRTADEKLGSWADRLGVTHRPGEQRWQIRRRCTARFRAAFAPTNTNIDGAAAELLGDAYVQTWRQVGANLATPPALTYWPGVNPGPAGYAITQDEDGDPAPWLSERCHFTIEVQRPEFLGWTDFLYLVDVQLFDLLDRVAPAWATFDWALGPLSAGFILDESQLDYTGLMP